MPALPDHDEDSAEPSTPSCGGVHDSRDNTAVEPTTYANLEERSHILADGLVARRASILAVPVSCSPVPGAIENTLIQPV